MKRINRLQAGRAGWKRALQRGAGVMMAASSVGTAFAAATDLSNEPLATSADVAAKPNIMFVLDNSGSMTWDYMPDDVADIISYNGDTYTNHYAYWSSQCNGVAYNPAVTYDPPVRYDGTSYPNMSFEAAWNDGFQPSFSSSTTSTTSLTFTSSGSVTLTLSGTLTLAVGDTVVIRSNDDTSRWMKGTVTSWNSATKTVTVNVTASTSNGTYASWTFGKPSTTNLANRYYYKYKGSEPAMAWTFDASGKVIKTSTFYTECAAATNSGSPKFEKVTMTSSSADAQNYANWYSYYRTRRLMMRSASGKAFSALDSSYRVGFTTISEKGVTPGSLFQDIADFEDTHKAEFFSRLYNATGNSSTPLRASLSKVGRYYAKQIAGQTYDPIQYSCQRNYTLLSTDGYWNTGSESATYGPFKLDGVTKVGQQDAWPEERPMRDASTTTQTTTETWSSIATTVTTVTTPRTTTYKQYSSTSSVQHPVNGWSRVSYPGLTQVSGSAKTIGSLTRCTALSGSNCTITVTINNHGYNTGDWVTIKGASPAVYNGRFQITRTGSNTFTYVLTGLSSRPNSPTANGSAYSSPGGCPAGQGYVRQQEQRRDEYSVTNTFYDVVYYTTPSTLTQVTTAKTTTPYTHTVVTTNGTVTSDTTTPGTATTSTTTTSSIETGPTSVTAPVNETTTANVFSDWTNYGPETTGSTCTSSLPSPNPSNPTQLGAPTSTADITSTGAGGSTAPVTTSGTSSTTVVGPTTTTTAKTTTSTTSTTGGVSNSLADVAEYYYVTDLRTPELGNCTGALGRDVCSNDVSPAGLDKASTQHMTTFTLGLGMNGYLKYDKNYLTQTSGDYVNLKNGTINWPNPSEGSDNALKIDDLWHAAVNGRGQYFSASNSTEVAEAIKGVLDTVTAVSGASSAAATSALDPVQGIGEVYVAMYKTQDWTGDLQAFTLDATKNSISTTAKWSAQAMVETQSNRKGSGADSRTIYYLKPNSATPTLQAFNWANLSADGLGGYFSNFCTQPLAGAQCATLTPTQKTLANLGSNMVEYLRGSDAYEEAVNTTNPLYRTRKFALGDIVNGAPVYVGPPPFKYTDTGYTEFVMANSGRDPVVYVAGNDGMLHAISAKSTTGGKELWAYVPRAIMPNLHALADTKYTVKHRYFVDGAPVVADIYTGTAWKTILVGGYNSGGKGYYAIDITDPNNPKGMWEFTDPNMGYTFGKPVIGKRTDGTWVVLLSSGYNNTAGDGNGHLFVLRASDGTKLLDLPTYTTGTTPAGSPSTPSGLGKVNAWVDSSSDPIIRRVYAGDLLGNLWRFDLDKQTQPYEQSMRLAQFQVNSTTPQPITVRPEVVEIPYGTQKYPVVIVATGRYLGTTDIEDTTQQSIYAVKDALSATGLGDVRQRSDIVKQVLTDTESGGKNIRTITNNPVDWGKKSGWMIDLPTSRERVVVNMLVYYNQLIAASAIPGTSECTPSGGTSWLYTLDLSTGSSVSRTTTDPVGEYLGSHLVAGLSLIFDTGASGAGDKLTKQFTDTSTTIENKDCGGGCKTTGTLRRTSWRELTE